MKNFVLFCAVKSSTNGNCLYNSVSLPITGKILGIIIVASNYLTMWGVLFHLHFSLSHLHVLPVVHKRLALWLTDPPLLVLAKPCITAKTQIWHGMGTFFCICVHFGGPSSPKPRDHTVTSIKVHSPSLSAPFRGLFIRMIPDRIQLPANNNCLKLKCSQSK